MAIYVSDCPHCRTRKIALSVIAGTLLNDCDDESDVAAFFLCPACVMPSCGIARRDDVENTVEPAHWDNEIGDIESLGWEVKEVWPEGPAPLIPENLPDDLTRIYLQAERNFAIEGNEDAAGTMYRKVLDVGLKKIDPDTKATLDRRIKKLAAEHKLTPDIAEWADHIRDLGNDAAHEAEPPTKSELTDLRNFTEMVIRYLFSLPALVQKRRAEIAKVKF